MPTETCPNCGGDGWVNGRGGHQDACPRCGGTGRITVSAMDRGR